MGPDARPIPLESEVMTQVPLVPNPTLPKRHVCAGMCPAQAPRVHWGMPSARPAWRLVLQAAASPHAPTNSAIHSENTHSLQYLRYSAEQCNPQ